MKNTLKSDIISWFLGLTVFTVGMLNLFLVHAIPGIVFLLLSFVFCPPMNTFLKEKCGFAIPLALKGTLFILIIWFTLGVSDLGDMIDG